MLSKSRNFIVKKVVIISISEFKIDGLVLDQEISVDNYKILRCDRNSHGRGAACYVRDDLSYKMLSSFPAKLKKVSLKSYYLAQQ